MEQLVIMAGTGLALSFGIVLIALVLKAALANARLPRHSKSVDPAELIQEPFFCESNHLAQAIRGYDTPELYRQDKLLRSQFSSQNSPDGLL